MSRPPDWTWGAILQRLREVPGLEVVETTPPRASTRTFLLHYTQPVDHSHPSGAMFRQRMTLIHQLRYPRSNVPSSYPPVDVEKTFDASIMSQVERWVRTDGQRMIFIYGENDPWSAAPFEVRERNDAYRLFEPGGNHTASIYGLSAAEQAFVMEKLSQWLGVSGQALAAEALPFEGLIRQERTPL